VKDFRNRVAVITGAGGGLGRALALELASHGCHLALIDVDESALAESARTVAGCSVAVSQHLADVADADRMAQLPREVLREHGAVHLLINNAGITLQKNFSTHSLADWQRVVGINFWGVLHGCHFFLDSLRAADEAHIVNLSSMSGFLGMPSQSSYCATKAAVKGLSEALWAEFALYDIGVTCVHPGAIRTEMIQATIAESDDIATAQRNYEIAQRFGIDADRAAKQIIKAVQKKRLRVRVGRDAILLDWLKRIAPVAIHQLFLKLARQQQSDA
jgi:short-subunit dehydrogenase